MPRCRFCKASVRWMPIEGGWKTASGSNCSEGPFGAHNALASWELAAETAIPEIAPLEDFVPERAPIDLDYWRRTYAAKPEWWDDPSEPRCDYCGVHTDDADGWCGDCGQCGVHCEC